MAAKAYSYTDAEGQAQTVNVTVSISACTRVQNNNPYNTGYIELSRSTMQITLSKALPVDLFVHFRQTVTETQSGSTEDKVTTKDVTFKVTAGNTSLQFDFVCREDILTTGLAISTSYVFLDQPVDTGNDKDIEEPLPPQELVYSPIPAYIFEFKKVAKGYPDVTCKVEIYKKEYNGIIRELTYAQSEPVVIQTRKSLEKIYSEPVTGTSLTLRLLQFEEDEFRDLFTSNDGDAKIQYYENDTLMFEGYNIAEYYRTNLSTKIQFVEVVFSDGIAILKQRPYRPATDTPRQKIIAVIWDVLKEIGTTLPLYDKTYIYPENVFYSVKKSAFEYIEVDVRTYVDNESGDAYTCYEVLNDLLRPFGCRMYVSWGDSKNAAWFIEEINARGDEKLKWRKYENNQLEAANANFGDFDRLIDQRDSTGKPAAGAAVIINRSRNQKIKPSYHRAVIEKNLEFIPRLIPSLRNAGDLNSLIDWSFTGGSDYASILFRRDVVGSNLALVGRTSPNSYPYNVEPNPNDTDFTNIKPVPDGTTYVESAERDIFAESGNTLALTINAGTYVTAGAASAIASSRGVVDSFLPVEVIIEGDVNTYYLSYTESINESRFLIGQRYILLKAQAYQVAPGLVTYAYTIPAAEIPVDGKFKVRIHQPSDISYIISGVNAFAPLDVTWFVSDISQEYQTSQGYTKSKETLYAAAEIRRNDNEYKTEIIHADADTKQNISSLTADGELTTTWNKYRSYTKTAQSLPLAQLLAQSIIENFYNADNWILEDIEFLDNGAGFIGTPYSFAKCITLPDYPTRRFICIDFEYSPRPASDGANGGKVRGTWVEVSDAQPNIRYFTDTRDSKNGRTASTGGAGGGTTIIQNPFDPKSVAKVQTGLTNTLPVIYDTDIKKYIVDVSGLNGGDGVQDTNSYINSGNFVTTSGDIVLNRVDLSGNITPVSFNIDGRYLKIDDYQPIDSHIRSITVQEKANWNTAYNDRITAIAVSGTTSKTITLTQQDGSTLTANFSDISGSGGTADGNDYINSVTRSGSSLIFGYNSAFPDISVNLGYSNTNITNWNTAYNDKINSISFSGTGLTKTLRLNQQDGSNLQAAFDIPVPTLAEVAAQGSIANTGIEIKRTVAATTGIQEVLQVTATTGADAANGLGAAIYLSTDRFDGDPRAGAIIYSAIESGAGTASDRHNFGIQVRDNDTLIDALIANSNSSIRLPFYAGTGNRLLYSTSNGTLANWTIGNMLEVGSGALRVKGTRTANYIPVVNGTNDGLNNSIMRISSNNAIVAGNIQFDVGGTIRATLTSGLAGSTNYLTAQTNEFRVDGDLRTGNPTGISSQPFRVGKAGSGNLVIELADGTTYQIAAV